MKISRTAYAVGHIDGELVTAAAAKKGRSEKKTSGKKSWFKWGAAAAVIVALIVAGAIFLPHIFSEEGHAAGKYKYHIQYSELNIEWPWEYLTFGEKFCAVNFEGGEYFIKSAKPVCSDLLGDLLGVCEAEGKVLNEDGKKYTETLEIRRINGVSETRFVAAGKDGEYYVYMLDSTVKPAALGEMSDVCGLEQNLELSYFTVYEGNREKEGLKLTDDDYIWEVLSECRDAKLCDGDVFDISNRNCLSFCVTSEALGVYKKVVYISEDGYFATNIFEYGYIYYIGEDAATRIIDFAKNNSDEAQLPPYELTVAGTVTEIGDDYVMIDDTVLCVNAKDGCLYKVYTDDLRIRRCIEYLNIEVGNIVVVKYDGTISANNEVDGAYSAYVGEIADGNIIAAE